MYSELDKAHANIVLHDASSASFAYYHSLFLQKTLYVISINSNNPTTFAHTAEHSALYFKSITADDGSKVAFAFDTLERLEIGAEQLFEAGTFSHIELPAMSLLQQLHGQFILDLNFGSLFREVFPMDRLDYLLDVNLGELADEAELARPQAIETNSPLSLIEAINLGNFGIVKKLAATSNLEIPADDEFGNTPLLEACKCNYVNMLEEIVKHGADLTMRNNYLFTALHCAASTGALQACEFLLAKGADIQAVDNIQWRPIHCAVSQGHIPVIKLLLQQDNDVEAPVNDTWGCTLLMIAAQTGRYAAVKLLLAQGANINAQQNYGWTALHCAAFDGHQQILELLLEAGADRTIRNDDGLTAFTLPKNPMPRN